VTESVHRKANRLEIWTLKEQFLVLVYSTAIYGTISMLQKIRPVGNTADHLFVGTKRSQYFTLAWNPETRQLDTIESFMDMTERHMKDSESKDRCLVDPTGRFMVLELFQGVLNLVKVVKRRKGNSKYLDPPEQARISELNVLATTFLYTETKVPKLALLYTDEPGIVRLSTYRIVDEKGSWSQFDAKKQRENDIGPLDPGANLLIPVPKGEEDGKRYNVRNQAALKAQLGGVLIVGETRILYLDDESKARVEYSLREAAIFCAWERIDDLHYLLGDDYGVLHVLEVLVDGAVVVGMNTRQIGRASKAETIISLGNGFYYIGSHSGNSQFLQISIEPEDSNAKLLQTFDNIAPILDFEVMDMGGRDGEAQVNEYSSGQARLVTGSGVFESGTLRSVRSGVGLEDVGDLSQMEGIRGVFALTSGSTSTAKDTILASFLTESRIFRFDSEGGIEEVEEFWGLSQDVETLLTTNISRGLILQVTTAAATIHNASGVVARWQPPAFQVITAASANGDYVLLSSNGRFLISLGLPRLQEVALQDLGDKDQVACVYIPQNLGDIGVVGFWKTGSISILSLKSLDIIVSEELRRTDDASIPRNIALTQILPKEISGPTLFIAMEDGVVLTFNVHKSNFTLSGRKSIVLGTQQAELSILPRKDGLFNVFATCEHPSLIYGEEGRIVYSAVTAENATYACDFDSEAFPNSIVVATSYNLKLAQIDRERRTHVKTLPIGETVRRIAYSAKEKAFGLGSIRRELIRGEEIISSEFRLINEVNHQELGDPIPLGDADGPELIECVIRAELPIQHGDKEPAERFIVGTSFLGTAGHPLDSRGRILVFGVDINRQPFLIGAKELKGSCRCLAIMDSKIVAALTKTVVVWSYQELSTAECRLLKSATYKCSTCPIDIDVTGNIIAVADLMKSLSLVQYTPGKDGMEDRLTEIGRHSQAIWSTAMISIGDSSYLESDHDGNLIVLKRNLQGVTEKDKLRLDVTSEMNLGEQVNKIRKIDVETTANAIVVPKAFLATVSLSIHFHSPEKTYY